MALPPPCSSHLRSAASRSLLSTKPSPSLHHAVLPSRITASAEESSSALAARRRHRRGPVPRGARLVAVRLDPQPVGFERQPGLGRDARIRVPRGLHLEHAVGPVAVDDLDDQRCPITA